MLSVFLAVALANAPPAENAARLTVHPMAVPTPALRHQLLPEVRELTTGNPVQWYLRCFAEQRNFFFSKPGVEERARYRAMTLAELAKQDLKTYGGSALTQADWAARLESPDWGSLQKVQTLGSEFRMPEIDGFRVLAIALQVRFRGEVARADWEGAIRTAKTMLAFARHLGESPALVANVLGLEVAALALDSIEEMIQQPNAPNLYWAFAELPSPLVSLRKGFQGERTRVDTELGGLLMDAAMTDEQLETFVARISGRIGSAREQHGRPPKNVRAAIQSRVEDRERAARIRSRLLKEAPADGVAEKLSALKILSFPPLQLILLDERSAYESRRDDSLKLLGLTPAQIDALLKEPKAGDGLFDDFLPAVVEHRRNQARIEQRIALLRCVEAIRHHGKLPSDASSLALPLPADPFTGKPFGLAMSGGIVSVSGTGKSYAIAFRH